MESDLVHAVTVPRRRSENSGARRRRDDSADGEVVFSRVSYSAQREQDLKPKQLTQGLKKRLQKSQLPHMPYDAGRNTLDKPVGIEEKLAAQSVQQRGRQRSGLQTLSQLDPVQSANFYGTVAAATSVSKRAGQTAVASSREPLRSSGAGHSGSMLNTTTAIPSSGLRNEPTPQKSSQQAGLPIDKRQYHPIAGPSSNTRTKSAIPDSDIVDVLDDEEVSSPKTSRAAAVPNGSSGAQIRSGGFGSHKRPSSTSVPRGRDQAAGSRARSTLSPTKPQDSPGKPLLIPDEPDEEEEVVEAVAEGGKYQNNKPKNIIPLSTNGPSDRMGKGRADPNSDSFAQIDDLYEVTPRGAGQGKRKAKDPLADQSVPARMSAKNRGTKLPSSNLNQEVALADLDVAWIGPYHLLIEHARWASDGMNRGVTLYKSRQSYAKFLRIPIDAVIQAKACEKEEIPMISLRCSFSGSTFDEERENLDALIDGHVLQRDLTQPEMVFAFSPRSGEGVKFVQGICAALRQRKISIAQLDVPAAQAFRSSCPQPLQSEEPRTRARKRKDPDSAHGDSRTELPLRKPRQSDAATEDGYDKPTAKRKAKEDPNQSKLDFSRLELPLNNRDSSKVIRKSSRLSGSINQIVDDGSDDEPKEAPGNVVPRKPALSAEERHELLFAYPLTGRAEIQIRKGERERMETLDFLNDTLIEFGLKFIMASSSLLPGVTDQVHLLNSFFFNKLSNKKQSWRSASPDVWPAYDSVKKWTRNKDIFANEYITVPINEQYHWYLAVIYNPKGILRAPPPSPESLTPIPSERVLRSSEEASTTVEHAKHQLVASTHDYLDELLDSSEDQADGNAHDETEVLEGLVHIADQSIDPLDVMEQSEDEGISNGVERMSVGETSPLKPPKPAQPINSLTLSIMNGHAVDDAPVADLVPPTPSPAVAKKEVKPSKPVWGSEECFVITFDSLGGGHKAVYTCLNRWLQFEARDKQGLSGPFTDANYVEARVPQQPNYSDCGLFLLHYVQQLLSRPEEIFKFIELRAPHALSAKKVDYDKQISQVWRAQETSQLRQGWIETIDMLTATYQSTREMEPVQAEADDGGLGVEELGVGEPSQQSVLALSGLEEFARPQGEKEEQREINDVEGELAPPLLHENTAIDIPIIPPIFQIRSPDVDPSSLDPALSDDTAIPSLIPYTHLIGLENDRPNQSEMSPQTREDRQLRKVCPLQADETSREDVSDQSILVDELESLENVDDTDKENQPPSALALSLGQRHSSLPLSAAPSEEGSDSKATDETNRILEKPFGYRSPIHSNDLPLHTLTQVDRDAIDIDRQGTPSPFDDLSFDGRPSRSTYEGDGHLVRTSNRPHDSSVKAVLSPPPNLPDVSPDLGSSDPKVKSISSEVESIEVPDVRSVSYSDRRITRQAPVSAAAVRIESVDSDGESSRLPITKRTPGSDHKQYHAKNRRQATINLNSKVKDDPPSARTAKTVKSPGSNGDKKRSNSLIDMFGTQGSGKKARVSPLRNKGKGKEVETEMGEEQMAKDKEKEKGRPEIGNSALNAIDLSD